LNAPIGVFDSGVGGLTVLRALRGVLPGADFVYLGDTARLPYGTKSVLTVTRYAEQCAALLVARGICGLVVACNTASAAALTALRTAYPALPVIGVIEPGARAAVACSRSQCIAVLATESTVRQDAYRLAITRLSPAAQVRSRACALFVALAEEGWTEDAIAQAVARRYLDPLFGDAAPGAAVPDTLVLGCTHFPLLAEAVRAVLPDGVQIVDSAQTTALDAAQQLRTRAAAGQGRVQWLATDGAERFARVGGRFFGSALLAAEVEIVNL
jgi:glutamate racemase